MRSLAAEFPNDNPALHRGAIWMNAETVGPAVASNLTVVDRADDPTPVTPAVFEMVEEAPTPVAEEIATFADDVSPEPPPAVVEEEEEEEEVVGPIEDAVPVALASGVVAVATVDEPSEEDDLVVEELPPFDEVAETAVATAANDVAPEESMTLPTGPDDSFTALICVMADVAIGAGSPFVAAVMPGLLLDGRLETGLSEEAVAAMRAGGLLDEGGVASSFRAITAAWQAILRGKSDDFAACGSMMLDEWAADVLARLLGAPDRTAQLRSDLRSRGVAAFGLVEAA